MEVFTLVTLAALVVKIVTVIKSIGKDNNIVLTQVVTWAVGIGILALAAHAMITSGIHPFGAQGPALGDLDGASIVLIGLSYASGGSLVYDFKKARDNTDTASEPALLPAKAAIAPTVDAPAVKAARKRQ